MGAIEIVGVVIAISRQMCETLQERLLPYYLNILLYLSYKQKAEKNYI